MQFDKSGKIKMGDPERFPGSDKLKLKILGEDTPPSIEIEDDKCKCIIQRVDKEIYELNILWLSDGITIHHILSWLPKTIDTTIVCGDVVYTKDSEFDLQFILDRLKYDLACPDERISNAGKYTAFEELFGVADDLIDFKNYRNFYSFNCYDGFVDFVYTVLGHTYRDNFIERFTEQSYTDFVTILRNLVDTEDKEILNNIIELLFWR